MKRALSINGNLITLGIPLSLLGILVLLMTSSFLPDDDTLNMAITADLLLTVPLVYFLLIRKTKIPTTTVVPVMIIGLILGSYLLPIENQSYLTLFKTWALPIIEISVFAFVIIKVRGAAKTYKEVKSTTPDFYSALRKTCIEVLPKNLALPLATEIAVIYFGFINWRTRPLQDNEYTYHKKSGTLTLFVALLLIIGIETVGLHSLLARWSIVAAWTLTILSIYTAIQVIGFAKSLSKRPISINQNSLTLKYGILNEVEISFADLETIKLSGAALEKDVLTKTLSPLGDLESHNVIIQLKNEKELVGSYGMKKKFKIIGLHLDEPIGFKEKVDKALSANPCLI
ncbi:MAG: hypothetical protein QNK23_14185 [Crocinitomicaceae bacterium]|nr:hypothetical protein [Crocinitomicaceae bacterium]